MEPAAAGRSHGGRRCLARHSCRGALAACGGVAAPGLSLDAQQQRQQRRRARLPLSLVCSDGSHREAVGLRSPACAVQACTGCLGSLPSATGPRGRRVCACCRGGSGRGDRDSCDAGGCDAGGSVFSVPTRGVDVDPPRSPGQWRRQTRRGRCRRAILAQRRPPPDALLCR